MTHKDVFLCASHEDDFEDERTDELTTVFSDPSAT